MARPYPTHTLEDALTIAAAIQRTNAGMPFSRDLLAGALGTTPKSSVYIMKLNSSARYGLTRGGYTSDKVSLAARGQAIVGSKNRDRAIASLVEAAMEPEVFGRFYKMLDGQRLPDDSDSERILQEQFGIHLDLAKECLRIIKANGVHVGIIAEVGDSLHVDLKDAARPAVTSKDATPETTPMGSIAPAPRAASEPGVARGGKIFLGYTGTPRAVPIVQAFLNEFQIPYGVASGDGLDPLPVPAHVSREMRTCNAAILVWGNNDQVDAQSPDKTAPAMLYQVGAASALYGERVLILREGGAEPARGVAGLPSVVFDGGKPEAFGLALLRELVRAGVIKVVT